MLRNHCFSFNKLKKMFFIVLLAVLGQEVVSARSVLSGNNACKSLSDYPQLKTSKNCWYNPDYLMSSQDLIKKYSGGFEEYKLTTDDGYFLTIFRMPKDNPRGVILLVPTMFTDAKLFLFQGNHSTALYFWRAGYDVWFYNQRGTIHSEGHLNLSMTGTKYWDFSFDEIVNYDLTQTVGLVSELTGSKIFIYGTSMGTTVSLIYAATQPEEAKRAVEAFIFAGTACYFRYSTSVVATLVPALENVAQELNRTLKLGSMFPAYGTFILIFRLLTRSPLIINIAYWVISLFFGWTTGEVDPAILSPDAPVLFKNMPWKIAFHYLQIERAKTRFQQYDYGRRKNRKLYGTDLPPEYPLKNITVPVCLIISDGDALTSLKDTEYLYHSMLPEPAKICKPTYISGMNHGEYHYGRHRKERVIDNVLKYMEQARSRKT